MGGARAERAGLSLGYRDGMGKASWKTSSARKDEGEEKGQLAKERGQRRVYLGSWQAWLCTWGAWIRSMLGGGARGQTRRALEAVVRGLVFDLRAMGSH